MQGAKIKILEGGGAKNKPNSPGAEAMLDVEMVTAMNYPLNNAYLLYDESSSVFSESLQYVLDQGLKPGVISVSWGSIESQIDQSAAQQLCRTAQQLTAQGTTILFASGDNGVRLFFDLFLSLSREVLYTKLLFVPCFLLEFVGDGHALPGRLVLQIVRADVPEWL